MLMMAVVAIGISGTFALADDSQPIGNTVDSQALFGHVEATVYDENGNIKFYTQSDNKIVNNGLDMIMVNTFSPSSTITGAIDSSIGPVTHMQLGLATTEEASASANTITPTSGTCTPSTFLADSAGAGGAVTLSATFTIAGGGAGCGEVIQEAGLFDAVTGSGVANMFAQNAFASPVDLEGTDSLVVNWAFTFTDN